MNCVCSKQTVALHITRLIIIIMNKNIHRNNEPNATMYPAIVHSLKQNIHPAENEKLCLMINPTVGWLKSQTYKLTAGTKLSKIDSMIQYGMY